MGLVDVFGKEDRMDITYTAFYELVKSAARSDFLMNAVRCNVPHQYIREMMTGKSETSSSSTKELINNIELEGEQTYDVE